MGARVVPHGSGCRKRQICPGSHHEIFESVVPVDVRGNSRSRRGDDPGRFRLKIQSRGGVSTVIPGFGHRLDHHILGGNFSDTQGEVDVMTKIGGPGLVEGHQVVLTEPIHEKMIRAIDLHGAVFWPISRSIRGFPAFIVGEQGKKPGIKGLLGNLLAYDIEDFRPVSIQIHHEKNRAPFPYWQALFLHRVINRETQPLNSFRVISSGDKPIREGKVIHRSSRCG